MLRADVGPRRPATQSAATVYVGLFIAIILGLALAPELGAILFLALAAWSVSSDRHAVQGLTIAWLASTLNPEIFSPSTVGYRWLVMGAAFTGVIYRMGPTRVLRWIRPHASLAVFGFAALASAALSEFPGLAAAKVAGFLIVAFTIWAVLGSRNEKESTEWVTRWFLALCAAVCTTSIPLLFSSIGFLRNGTGFQGVLSHPQALGIFLAPYLAFLAVRSLTVMSDRVSLAGASTIAVLLFLTESRTAVVAALFGVAIAVGYGLWRQRQGAPEFERKRLLVGLGVGVVLIAAVFVSDASSEVSDFVFKSRGESAVNLAESFERSRGGLIESSWDRFSDSPVVGHGFGVSAGLTEGQIETAFGIPVGSPVESGFVLSGLLEQVGLIGTLSVVALLVQFLRPVYANGPLIAVGLATAAIATNLGEATATSFGGMGLFLWLMLGWGLVLAVAGSGTRSRIRSNDRRSALPSTSTS